MPITKWSTCQYMNIWRLYEEGNAKEKDLTGRTRENLIRQNQI